MVQSSASTVSEWMAGVGSLRAPALHRLRDLCIDRLVDWQERMQWGMPGYGPAGADSVVSFNNQKLYIAFYAGPTAIAAFANRLTGIDRGKGCLRFRRPESIDFALIADMLDEIRGRGGPMC
ncbi:iron chaperone [Sphingobium olei]|uniref:Iron chaperone n=1 Tax=Sphingobium olei TaxID=420955 RepID=A0ABW3P0C0_9SPHN